MADVVKKVVEREATPQPAPQPTKQAEPEKPEVEVKPEKPADAEKPALERVSSPAPAEDTSKGEKRSLRASLAQPEAPAAVTEPTHEDDAEDPTLTEGMRKRVNKLKGDTAKEREARLAAEKKAAELEARIAELDKRPVLTEAQQKEIEAKEADLLRLRRLHDLDSDPETKKFDQRISSAQEAVNDRITNSSLPSWVKDEIKAVGGLEALARSGKEYEVAGKEPGEKEKISGAELYRRVLGNMNPADADAVRFAIAEQARIAAEKKQWRDTESKNAREYFDKQSQAQQEAIKEQERVRQQTDEMFAGLGQKIVKHEKWLQDEPVPATGDEEAIASAKESNAVRARIRALVNETVTFKPTSTNPTEALKETETFYRELIRDSARVFYVDHQLSQAQKRIKKLEAELDGIKNASRTTPRSGGNGVSQPAAQASKVPAPKANEGSLAYGIRLQQEGVADADRLAALRQHFPSRA